MNEIFAQAFLDEIAKIAGETASRTVGGRIPRLGLKPQRTEMAGQLRAARGTSPEVGQKVRGKMRAFAEKTFAAPKPVST